MNEFRILTGCCLELLVLVDGKYLPQTQQVKFVIDLRSAVILFENSEENYTLCIGTMNRCHSDCAV